MPNEHEIIAMRLELQKLEEKIQLMKQLRTTDGFIQFFFKEINNHKNRRECFDAVNELFFELYGEYRYSDYASFRVMISKPQKK